MDTLQYLWHSLLTEPKLQLVFFLAFFGAIGHDILCNWFRRRRLQRREG